MKVFVNEGSPGNTGVGFGYVVAVDKVVCTKVSEDQVSAGELVGIMAVLYVDTGVGASPLAGPPVFRLIVCSRDTTSGSMLGVGDLPGVAVGVFPEDTALSRSWDAFNVEVGIFSVEEEPYAVSTVGLSCPVDSRSLSVSVVQTDKCPGTHVEVLIGGPSSLA